LTSVRAIKILMAGELETPISIDGLKSLKTKRHMSLETSRQLLTIQYKFGRNFAKKLRSSTSVECIHHPQFKEICSYEHLA
jgi:hypothetical protein